MNFEKALGIIRNKFKDHCVICGFDYDNAYCFIVSVGKNFNKDEQPYHCKVDKNNGDISYFYFMQELTRHPNKFNKALDNVIYVDVKKEDLN